MFLLIGIISLTVGIAVTGHNAVNLQPSNLSWASISGLAMPLVGSMVFAALFFVAGVRSVAANKLDAGITPKCILQYQARIESPIRVSLEDQEISISRSRSYQILNYMFEHEDFDHFFAVDMAIRWWHELDDGSLEMTDNSAALSSDDSVTNESNRILEGITRQFHRPAGCKIFQRLFVVTRNQISLNETKRVFRIISAQESTIRERKLPGRHIESRYIVWETTELEHRHQLGMIHDVACWTIADAEFALIDRQITRPLDGERLYTISDRTHSLCVDRKRINEIRGSFNQLFDKATPISQL